jgi:hypothetical protein
MQVRRVLWAACELVLENSYEFASAAKWLEETFSESATRQRELAKSEAAMRLQMEQGVDAQNATPQREERDSLIVERVKDRGWRLELAVRELLAEGAVAQDKQEERARRIVLVACVLSYHRELPLSGEFCSWTWESAGTEFAAWLDRELSATYVAGRSSVLFGSSADAGMPDWLDGFVPLVKRAVILLDGATEIREVA